MSEEERERVRWCKELARMSALVFCFSFIITFYCIFSGFRYRNIHFSYCSVCFKMAAHPLFFKLSPSVSLLALPLPLTLSFYQTLLYLPNFFLSRLLDSFFFSFLHLLFNLRLPPLLKNLSRYSIVSFFIALSLSLYVLLPPNQTLPPQTSQHPPPLYNL